MNNNLNHLLSDWKHDRLKDRVRFAYGDSLAAEDRINGDVNVFGSNGVVGSHNETITEGPTVIIGRKGSFGKITWSDQSCFPIDTTYFVDHTQTCESLRWLYYALQDLELDTVNFDSAVPGLSREITYSLTLAYPPLPEQQRIAAYLDASCAAIDAAVAAKRRQLETLDDLRKAALHSAFANENWPAERIKDVAIKIGSGVTPEGGASGYLDEGIPLLRSQNVYFDGLRLDDVAFISKETHDDMVSSQLKPRDVLLNITGASIGRCNFVPEDFGEGNVNQHVCIIRVNHKLDHQFLAAFLASPKGQGQVLSSFTGASRQGLSHKELGLISIPLPKLTVQHDIVEKISQQDVKQNHVRKNIEAQIATLAAYRKSLIHECVTGQRRVTEADIKGTQAHG